MALNSFCCEPITDGATFQKKCNVTPRSGGIPYLGAIDCSIDFTDITDVGEWESAIASGSIVLFPKGLGEKPETEKTTQRMTSCDPEQTVLQIHPLNFQTFDANLTDNSDFDNWIKVEKNQKNYRFFYIDCQNNIYLDLENNQGIEARKFDLDHVIPQTNEEKQSFNIVLNFQKNGIIKPFKNDAILEALLTSQGS